MGKLDDFIKFLFERLDGINISANKKVKYGHRYYYLVARLEIGNTGKVTPFGGLDYSSISIVIDNRNKCIEMFSNSGEYTIESEYLVNKWSEILEKYISDNIEEDIDSIITDFLSSTKDKYLLREFQMEKILKDDNI
jgi:hypothetical protein